MSPKAASKPAHHRGDLRAQLIAAVRGLIETDGPDGFSVAEAARRAGVSSAAPYKRFKDRPGILRAVAGEAMDHLHQGMEGAAAQHPTGSLEAVAAIGKAYVDFARSGPGVFRLIFSLTAGHEHAPELMAKGRACFDVVLGATAAHLVRGRHDPDVQRRAYILWSAVHGHSFLTIDRKTDVLAAMINDRVYLMTLCRAVLGRTGAP